MQKARGKGCAVWRGNSFEAEFKGGWSWFSRVKRNWGAQAWRSYGDCQRPAWTPLHRGPHPPAPTSLTAQVPERTGHKLSRSLLSLPPSGNSLAGQSTHVRLHVPEPWPIFQRESRIHLSVLAVFRAKEVCLVSRWFEQRGRPVVDASRSVTFWVQPPRSQSRLCDFIQSTLWFTPFC